MKKILTIAALAIGLGAFTAQAAPDVLTRFAGTGTTPDSSGLSYAVVSALGQNSQPPVITYLNLGSDTNASALQFYSTGTGKQGRGNSTVTLFLESTNGITTNLQVIIIQHSATDTYERRVTTGSTASTNIIVTVAPTTAISAGDVIYPATAAGVIPWSRTTNSIGPADGIYSGQGGKPLLMDIGGTTNGRIFAVSAKYTQ